MFESYLLTTDGKEYVDANSVREALGIVDEYADIIGLVRKLKQERDELKDKVDRMKARANAVYGTSCGKEPAFLCDVISYSWEFGSVTDRDLMGRPTYRVRNDSIRVELNLTPTANYKGTIDMEDLKRYIQNYGREKKLSDFEVFCKLVDNCIDELCDKYNVVRPDRNRTTRERLDYIFRVLTDYRELADDNYRKAEGFRKEKRAVEDSLAELRAKVCEIYRSVVDDEWDEHLSYTSAMNDINEEYKRVVHNFEERTADWHKAQQDLDRYKLAVGSLLGIPKEVYKSLQKFRDDVCEILDIPPSSMTDEQILKEIHDIIGRYDELEDFRADICGALNIEGMLGTPKQNDKYILEQVEKLKNDGCKPTVFRNDVAVAIGMTQKDSNPDIIKRVIEIREAHDRLARLRSDICTALCLGCETDDEDILKRVRMTREYHDKLFEARHDHEVMIRDLWELRKNAIAGLKSRGFCFRPEENETLPEIFAKLLKRYDWTYGSYKEQYRLRQMWHLRWESENERANGEHKCAEKLRSEGAALKNQVEILKIAKDAKANELVALQAFKNECRKLKEEKTKVIYALGQDIWDDCVK